ncbi:cellulase family glycosylhydrolase [Mycobacterium sp. NPDC048908]|uniref:cellulase family glycosylhydrolase n=1 Tax=Mycobacterium sp. NPDC048908 TaxID=3364292 RepID=UPI00371ADF1C
MTNLLAPTSPLPRPVSAATYHIVETAVIKEESDTIGVADSDLYNATDAEIEARFDEMQALGVNTVRVIVPWAAIKPAQPGSPLEQLFPPDWKKMDRIIQEATDRGFSVLGVLNSTPYYGGQDGTGCLGCVGVAPDPTAFAAFAAEVAQRYQGEISAYEVWNEPNSYKTWSPAVDPVAYTNVLKAAYTAIKAADPNATVVAGVLGAVITAGGLTMDPVTFVKSMYANGAKGFFDALSYHPYNYQRTFAEQNPGFLSPLQMLLQMRQTMLDNGDDLVKIWASEYGLPTSLNADQAAAYQNQLKFISDFLTVWGDGLTDAQMAQLPAQYREIAESWKDWVGPAFIYSLRDRLGQELTEQGSFGLYYFDEASGEWKLKPAGEWIRDIIKERQSSDLAAALAASLQKLVQQVATAVQTTVVNQVVPAVQQTVQQIGSQVGNALAQALAAWAASFKKTPTTTSTVAAIQSVDTAAVAEKAVTETFGPADAATPATQETTEKVSAPDEPAADKSAKSEETKGDKDPTPAAATAPEAATGAEPAASATRPAATDDTKTPDDPKATTPATRKENDDDAKGGDAKKDGDKKAGGDNKTGEGKKGARGNSGAGKHAKGAVRNGTSVDQIKDKLGEDTTKAAPRAPKHAASEDASASAAG